MCLTNDMTIHPVVCQPHGGASSEGEMITRVIQIHQPGSINICTTFWLQQEVYEREEKQEVKGDKDKRKLTNEWMNDDQTKEASDIHC